MIASDVNVVVTDPVGSDKLRRVQEFSVAWDAIGEEFIQKLVANPDAWININLSNGDDCYIFNRCIGWPIKIKA